MGKYEGISLKLYFQLHIQKASLGIYAQLLFVNIWYTTTDYIDYKGHYYKIPLPKNTLVTTSLNKNIKRFPFKNGIDNFNPKPTGTIKYSAQSAYLILRVIISNIKLILLNKCLCY